MGIKLGFNKEKTKQILKSLKISQDFAEKGFITTSIRKFSQLG